MSYIQQSSFSGAIVVEYQRVDDSKLIGVTIMQKEEKRS